MFIAVGSVACHSICFVYVFVIWRFFFFYVFSIQWKLVFLLERIDFVFEINDSTMNCAFNKIRISHNNDNVNHFYPFSIVTDEMNFRKRKSSQIRFIRSKIWNKWRERNDRKRGKKKNVWCLQKIAIFFFFVPKTDENEKKNQNEVMIFYFSIKPTAIFILFSRRFFSFRFDKYWSLRWRPHANEVSIKKKKKSASKNDKRKINKRKAQNVRAKEKFSFQFFMLYLC